MILFSGFRFRDSSVRTAVRFARLDAAVQERSAALPRLITITLDLDLKSRFK